MVKEQKTFGTQNRSNRGRKYGRRILCLILALVFTLTGLPMGGVMETKAARGIVCGTRSYGTYEDGVLKIITSAISGDVDADSSCDQGVYDYIKTYVTKLEIGTKITKLTNFEGLTSLETIEFNSEPIFDSTFLNGLDSSRHLTIKLPLNCSPEFKTQVERKFGTGNNITYENQYVLHIINSDSINKPNDYVTNSQPGTTTSNAYYFKYSDSSFTSVADKQIKVKIQPMKFGTGNMMFHEWVMAGGRETTGSDQDITGVTLAEDPDLPNVSGAAILTWTLTSEMPAEVFVTAHYKSKAELGLIEETKKRATLEKALDQVLAALDDYSSKPENEIDSVPTSNAYVQTYLKAILDNMKKMTNDVFDFSMTSFKQVENSVQQPTTSTQGAVTYQFDLKANYAGIEETTPCALILKVKRKQNIPYTVIVSGGSIQGATSDETLSPDEFKKTYFLSDIEQNNGSLPFTLISTDCTSSNYYFDGWDIRTDDSGTSVSLTDISSTDGNQATGSAKLELKEESPLKIYVTAKYKYVQPTNPGSTGGGWVPTTPTTPEKPKEEEKPKDPEKPTDAEKTDPETPTPTDPTSASKPISTTTKTNTATVSVSDLQKAVDGKTNAGMTLKYKNATVTFDAKAVESIVKQAKKIGSSSLKVVCKADAQSSLNSAQKKALKSKTVIGCYQVYLKCGSKTISDFGTGKVKVKVPLKLKSGQKSKNVKLYYVDEKGKLTKQTASYSNGKLTFSTTHFSIYAAIYPKQTTTTASDKTATSDKTGTTDKTEKPTQVIGKKNETVPGGVVDDSMVGLPKAEEYEQISYQTLQLHLSRSNDTSVCLGWNQVPGASGYELYGARCNTKTKKYEIIQITTLDAPSMNAWMCENLKENTYYKFIVRAYMKKDGEKIYIARSRSAHVSTGGGGYGFIKDVTVDKPQVTLGVGKTTVVKATIDTAAQKIRSHYDLRFESSDSSIATVSTGGKITAKKNGTCTIYVYTQNGLYTTVKVTVK